MSYDRALVALSRPYWEAEAIIARRFFSVRRSREDHIFWLKAQLWKELHPVDGYFSGLHRELKNLAEMFPRVDRTVDRHAYYFLLEQMVQEFNHYLLQADILESLLGRRIGPRDTIQLSEEKKLGDIRRRYTRSGSPIDRAAVLFTEGGGARLFREGRKLQGGRLERKIARAMDIIYRDEKDHYKEAARQAANVLKSKRDFSSMAKIVEEISLQRVYMRNEMFRQPLSNSEIKRYLRKWS